MVCSPSRNTTSQVPHSWPTCRAKPPQKSPSPPATYLTRPPDCTRPSSAMDPRSAPSSPLSATSAAASKPPPPPQAASFPRAPLGGGRPSVCPWRRSCSGGNRRWRQRWHTMRTARRRRRCCRCFGLWSGGGRVGCGARRSGLRRKSALCFLALCLGSNDANVEDCLALL